MPGPTARTPPLLILHLAPRHRAINPSRGVAEAHSSAFGREEGNQLLPEPRTGPTLAGLFHPSMAWQRPQPGDDRAAVGQGAKLWHCLLMGWGIGGVGGWLACYCEHVARPQQRDVIVSLLQQISSRR